MGTYACISYHDVNTGALLHVEDLTYKDAWYEIGTHDYAVYFARLVTAEPVWEERKTCFCCSCPPEGPIDLACRNHGGLATRPCTAHNQPGDPYPDGALPDSVQDAIARRSL